MNRHYYIEDININPRIDDIKPTEYVHSIQFDKFADGRIYINIDEPMDYKKSGKRALRASLVVELKELEEALKWLKEPNGQYEN
jgi:hypothetical protein